MLTGSAQSTVFKEEPHNEWFEDEYQQYEPSDRLLSKIDLPDGLEIDVVLGTWCSDSRREVPRFFKVLDELGYTEPVRVYFVDKNKKDPDGLTAKWYIEKVPTFIFSLNGEEIGRIVETPDKTLEKDLKKLLKNI